MLEAVLPYAWVVDINSSGYATLCGWLLTLMPVAVLPCVFVDINASGSVALCVCC